MTFSSPASRGAKKPNNGETSKGAKETNKQTKETSKGVKTNKQTKGTSKGAMGQTNHHKLMTELNQTSL